MICAAAQLLKSQACPTMLQAGRYMTIIRTNVYVPARHNNVVRRCLGGNKSDESNDHYFVLVHV